jgi:hypothetical protein
MGWLTESGRPDHKPSASTILTIDTLDLVAVAEPLTMDDFAGLVNYAKSDLRARDGLT